MATKARQLIWQIPLTLLACIAGSLVVVRAVSRGMGFTMNPSLVGALSAVLAASAMAAELRGRRGRR